MQWRWRSRCKLLELVDLNGTKKLLSGQHVLTLQYLLFYDKKFQAREHESMLRCSLNSRRVQPRYIWMSPLEALRINLKESFDQAILKPNIGKHFCRMFIQFQKALSPSINRNT